MKESIIKNKSFDFALEIIEIFKELKEQKEFVLSRQLLRSGTSIGSNVKEALSGQSTADFLAKMYIALKEAQETEYWLELLMQSKLVDLDFTKALKDIKGIILILTSITKTTKEKTQNSKLKTQNFNPD